MLKDVAGRLHRGELVAVFVGRIESDVFEVALPDVILQRMRLHPAPDLAPDLAEVPLVQSN